MSDRALPDNGEVPSRTTCRHGVPPGSSEGNFNRFCANRVFSHAPVSLSRSRLSTFLRQCLFALYDIIMPESPPLSMTNRCGPHPSGIARSCMHQHLSIRYGGFNPLAGKNHACAGMHLRSKSAQLFPGSVLSPPDAGTSPRQRSSTG
jgi:hypothetical protein